MRAAMLHIARSENLRLEHNRWLGEEIFARFEKDAQHFLYYLTLDTRRDRPAPQFDPEEMFPNRLGRFECLLKPGISQFQQRGI